MELDTNQTSVGYQLGRLFAVLEKIQKKLTLDQRYDPERFMGQPVQPGNGICEFNAP